VHARAAPDDLLELGHRADGAVEHDQAAGLRIDAGGEQREVVTMTGILRLGVDEVAELAWPSASSAGDAHDVALVLQHQVGFSLISAWRMRAACSVSTQKTMVFWKRSPLSLRKSVIHRATVGAVVDDQRAVEVLDVVDAVVDSCPSLVGLAFSAGDSPPRRRRGAP
jgi:hypothetical protein